MVVTQVYIVYRSNDEDKPPTYEALNEAEKEAGKGQISMPN